jgi:hypothetical protein
MARIRTVKPEFWVSEQIVECSTNARLLFIGLWNFCDDAGRHPASIRRIKMEVFPGDAFSDEDVAGWVDELVASGLLCHYESQGKCYLAVTGWDRHQKIEHPTVRYPGPFDDHSTNVRRTLDERSPLEGKGREGKGEEGNGEGKGKEGKDISVGQKPDRTAEARQVCDHYRTYHPKAHTTAKSKEWRSVQARLAEGFTAEDLIEAIDGAHLTPYNLGANDRGQKYLGLELILRTGDQVTRFIENNRDPPRPVNDRERRSLDGAREWLARRERGNATE